MSSKSANALMLLKKDHTKVKGLFSQFEKTKGDDEKRKLAQEAIRELKIHTAIEEEIFYPTVRERIHDAFLMDEAKEEHHVAKVIISELAQMDLNGTSFDAKFMVLAENIRHHIKEEEGEMFPKIKKADIDLNSLGERMLRRKEELMSQNVSEPTPSDLIDMED